MNCPLKRWTRRKKARPQEILVAALSLFVEKGYAATKIEDIARAAGVTRGTPYLYFANKEEIFKSVIRELLLPQISQGDEIVNHWQGSIRDLFVELMHFWWTQLGAEQLSAMPKLMLAEGGNFPDVLALYREGYVQPGNALIRRVLQLGIERGEFAAVDLDYAPHIISSPVIMAMISQHSLHCLPEQFDPKRYLQTILDILLTGLLQRKG
ncbi:TetR/AcrR family transcriptional regulator [Chitinibacter tainanensis]|uniref:TetR/AcrR family transcriptional regulator n=1 Tax=Chitinibacter tainanensis TaxID=230667 RepID=UPI0023556371|nr:TetR/AcrR family transcriptional regulator [Chitinibacter tainanensis]